MNISISCSVYSELHDAIKNDPVLAGLEDTSRLTIEWPSREFDALKSIWHGKSRLTALLEFGISDELLSQSRLFEVWGVDIRAYDLSDADDRYFRSQEECGPLLAGVNCAAQYFPAVRYFPEIKLSNPRVKPKHISSLEAPWPAYFIGDEEAKAWRGQSYSGLKFGPVYPHRGQHPHQGVSLIVPEYIMGPMTQGRNVIEQKFVYGNTKYTHPVALGFMVYTSEQISAAKDFNFTCEPVCTYGYPRILVSRRFVDFYRERGVMGWKLRPVLETGSIYHREFVETLDRFMADWNTGHSDNRIDG